MKNKVSKLLLLIVFVISFVKITNAGDRMMLIEFFTSSTCGPCASNNPTMTAFVQSMDPDRLVAIGYHMNWPGLGNDPMYLYNSTDNTARRNYYGINSIPAGQFDGFIGIPIAYSQSNLLATYDSRKDILSPITIILTDSTYSTDSVLVRATIYCETYLANPSVTAFIALEEELIQYSSPPGTNGEKDFHWVMRKVFPTGTGTPITLLPGKTVTIQRTFKKDPIWQWNQITPIAFVQASNKEILNAARKTANFTLLANPGFQAVTPGQASTKNYKVSVPVVASGYNSPVTFTATVVPPTAGITASFPNGNVLSAFPDSVTVQVSSTASVPTGSYQIVVTGTNSAGKYHKIGVDYLVGKNYVTVKTNVSGLDFNVNGSNYNSPRLFNWDIGSTQTLQVVSPQVTGTKRYIFQNWSNNSDTAKTQVITVNATTGEYIANFKTQFRIYAFAEPSGIPVTITNSYDFFDSGSVINLTVSPLQLQHNGLMYYFNNWFGVGNGSYSGANPICQVTMLNPITELVTFDTISVGINQISSEIPERYNLYQNYPNPFNPETKIKFDIPKSGIIKLRIYDMLGKEVQTLYSGHLNTGKYEFKFNGIGLASGMYFYKLETENFTQIMKMLLLK
ncbi:MAG: T9SS type A sorting domain-containing protein [Ignavibacteria bacterium]|jgi:thiol-disulfide isomerase/thioredoxin